MWFTLHYFCLVTVVLCIEQPRLKNFDEVKQSFNFRRAIDGRGARNYFDHDNDGSYDSSHTAAGHYDSSQVKSGYSDIKSNVPGEPGVDYPIYEKVPKTRFSCEGRVHGYYADEDAGCQAFHVCHDVVVSSFICPVGAIFSQKLLTCDWWNRVDCASTQNYHSSRQGTFKDANEMVQKAYPMTVLPERDNIKSELQIGERPYYSYNPTEQPGVPKNFQLGRNEAVFNDNTQSQKNIINVNLRPRDFEVNYRGQDSGLNNREDSSLVYIQKNANYNPQDSYSTLRPSRLENNFPNYYQQNEKVVGYEFQPSYAPTVPTVTTTTRRLYSPTVPTTYRPSTISYNKEDQYFDSSEHFYTHGTDVNFMTTRSTIDYHDSRVDDGRFEHPNNLQRQIYQQSDHADQTTANKRQDQYDFSEIVQSTESIATPQSYRGSSDQGKDNVEEEAKSQTGTTLQTGESPKQDTFLLNSRSNFETTRTQLGTKPTSFISDVSANEQNYQHFYSNLLNPGMKQFSRATGNLDGVSADNDTQAQSTVNTRDGKSVNSINSRLGIPPLIVQIPRPSGSTGRPLTDIVDQLFTFDSLVNMSTSTPETTESEVPNTNSMSVGTRIQDSDPSSSISPLIPETSQFGTSTGLTGDDETFDSLPRIPPLISDLPTSFGSTDVEDQPQTFGSTGITPLIPQISQSGTSTGLTGDEETFDSPSKIPPLISDLPLSSGSTDVDDQTQTVGSTTAIPPLIPPISQSGISTGLNGDEETFDPLPSVPPLISEIPQPSESTDIADQPQTFESSTEIPPFIPPTSQSGTSTGLTGDGEISDSSSRIPPLISDLPLPSESTGVDDQPQTFGSTTGIPPLIPEISQSGTSNGLAGDGETFDSSQRIPPLISDLPLSSGSTDLDDQSQTFESSGGIPPLIPEISQSGTSTGLTGDEDTFDPLPSVPPLISEIPQSPGSTDITGQPQTFESSTGIPPFIPPSSQSGTSTELTGDEGTFNSPSGIPPLISEIPQSPGATDITGQPQTFESSTGIPPFIPPSSQSGTSTELTGDEGTFNSPSGIPPLISEIPQSSVSTDIADQPQTFESSTRIPPLIPPTSQSGVSTGLTGDDETFDSPPRIPPLISDFPLSSESTDVDDQSQTLGSTTGIPPLIPEISQSGTSNGLAGDANTFNSPSGIPPLISEIPQSSVSTHIADQPQTFESSTRIPPLIPPTSQSGVSTGLTRDDETFDSPPRTPPLISDLPLSSGSTDLDDQPQTFESSSGISPLIPQISQSGTSTGPQTPSVIGDDGIFDSPPRIPPLISEIPQSSGSTEAGDQPQTFETSTRIPLLIPQTSRPETTTGLRGPTIPEDGGTFDSPSRIPPLIFGVPQSPGSTDVRDQPTTFHTSTRIPPLIPETPQSGTTIRPQGPSVIGDDGIFDSPPRIPPLISEIPQSSGSTEAGDQPQTFETSTRIPLLIPQTSRPETTTGLRGPTIPEDGGTFDSPSRIPPLIFGVPQSPGSTDVRDQPTTFHTSTRIPPLIPETPQSGTTIRPQGPSIIGDDQTFDSPSRKPPLIFGVPQSPGSTDVRDQPTTFHTSTRIPPLIPETPQSGTTIRPQGPSIIGDDQTFDSPSRKPPLIFGVPQYPGSTDVTDPPKTFESSTKIPTLIPDTSQSEISSGSHGQSFPPIVSSGAHPMQPVEQKFNSYIPPKVPPFSSQISRPLGLPGTHTTNIFGQKQSSESSDKTPLPFFGAPRPVHSSGTLFHKVFDSFNSFPSTAQPSYFTFQGQYQRPLAFGLHQTPPSLSEHQFVTTPTPKIPAYNFNVKSGWRLRTETVTDSPFRDFVDSATKEFRINVPEFPVTQTPCSTQSSILSTPKNHYLPSAIPSIASVDESPSVVSINEKSYTAPSHIIQTPVQVPKVVPHSLTIDYQQSSVTDLPSMTLTPLPPRNHSEFSIPTEQKVNEHTHTEVKGPTFTPSIPNEDRSGYNSFNEASPAISSIADPQRPSLQYIGSGHLPESNGDQQFTIRGSLPFPTTTPAPSFNRIFPTHLSHSNDSPLGAIGQGAFEAKDSNIDHGSYSENPFHKEYQESTTPNVFDRVTSVRNDFIQISSPSSYENFGFSEESFESSTLNSILDTTSIRPAEKHDTSVNELLQAFGTSGLRSHQSSAISGIESSLNNNDSPYEFHFTVNANENFNPSEEFISNILAQRANDSPLGLNGFEGYEIIKSENPEDGFNNQNSNLSTQIQTASETDSPKTKLLNSENLARPFFFSNNQDVASQTGQKSTDTSIINSSFLDSSVQHEAFQGNINLSDLKANPEDINRSFESLFELAPHSPESPPLTKEHILKQLTENFGQPLYNSDSQGYFASPEAFGNLNDNAGQQFSNLGQYRVGKDDFSNQEAGSPSPAPPAPSAITLKPVKTFVQTEFIPSLSFSFDSDDGRKEYIDAVLQGLLTENHPVDPWTDDTNFYRISRENLKPSNQTTKT